MLSVVTYEDMFMNFTQQFLQSFEEIASNDFQTGTYVDFEIAGRDHKNRINPMIRMATSEDIDEIIFIYKDVYDDSYPYKEMEDRKEIRKMLESPNVEWLIFETVEHEIVGCFTFMLDFDKKMGNIRGFNLKKKFLGKLDIMKMAMGSIIAMYKKYNDRIFRWYGECRTAHSKSQYFLSALGFKPVGFYPCKDIFYDKVESDLLILSYDERALTTMRSNETPKVLPEALSGFLYSDSRYNLGSCKIVDSNNLDLNVDSQKISELQKNLIRHVSKDKFGYESIKLCFENSDSFFEFLYTPTVQNFEKTHYKVKFLEELYIFVHEFLEYGKKYEIRYCEAFISAYKPAHQKIFSELGLHPSGYVPSWKYNQKTGTFEDCILFNWFEGEINNIRLLDEGKDLLEILGIQYSIESKLIQEEKTISSTMTTLGKKCSSWNLPKVFKSSIVLGLILYLTVLFSSLGIASIEGYKITTHTISELALSNINLVPFLFEFSCILGGLTSVCFYYLLSKRFGKSKKLANYSKYGMITGMLGSVGIILVGIFSLERTNGILHGVSSLIAFGGYIISISAFSLKIYHLATWLPRLFILNGVVPIISLILYFTLLSPLSEWIMLIAIICTLIPLFCWIIFR
ncbi:MAG: DUF998 domain-containing protein [Candidatus Lokiarchaeota archaeon]|nr:DUF998 domain-containing protein [Candidatus Lokiarchaeota archaeon]